MDPFSTIVSVVGITGVVAKSLNNLKKILGARAEFHALINEISDLQVVLGFVQAIVWDCEHHDVNHSVSVVLNRIKTQLLELDQLIQYRLKRLDGHDKNGQIKLDRRRWFQETSTIKKLQQRLRDSRQNLVIVLACNNATKQSHIEMKLQSIYVQMMESNANISQLQTRVIESLTENSSAVGSIPELPSQTRPPVLAHSNVCQREKNSVKLDVEDLERKPIKNDSSTSIKTSAFLSEDSNECRFWCNCACHIRRKFSTPRLLKNFLGQLFIGYTGIKLMKQQCDQSSCHRGSKIIQISYCFPPWFFTKLLFFSIATAPFDGPQLSLIVPRIVDEKAAVFFCARNGDVEGIKSLFESGTASPRDMSWIGGYTALHVAVYRNQTEVCRFLLAQNADPFHPNFYNITPIENAWDSALTNLANHKSVLQLFPKTQFLEKRKFSFLHLVVLGLTKSPRNLRIELEQSTSFINATDFHGRTALHWAAARGDSYAVDTLLTFGADLEIADNLGSTALHYSAWNKTRCLELLLTSGANPNCKNKNGDTPLHWAATAATVATDATKPQSVEMLLQHGAELNATNICKVTPLFNTCESIAPEYADPSMNSVVEALDYNGNPVGDCVSNTIRILLSHDASYHIKTSFNETILHAIASARFVVISSIRVLKDLNWRGVDVNTINSAGYTAKEMLLNRLVSPDVSSAYEALFSKVEADNRKGPRVHEVTKQQDPSVFEDAVEYQ